MRKDTNIKALMKSLQSNILLVAAAELLIYNGGLQIKYEVQHHFGLFASLVGKEYEIYFNANFWIIIPIILTLIFMRLTCPEALSVFTEGSFGRKMKSLGRGLLIGTVVMVFLTLLTCLSGAVTYHYQSFNFLIIPLIFFVFIQCCAEEMLLRGYVPAVLDPQHRNDAVAFVSGALFIFHHIFNMESLGFSTLFCLNVFLLGVWFYYLVKLEGNFWIACGLHTSWNYVQSYLFGAPNSGYCYPISLMGGENTASSFFFDYVYGFEGSLCTTVTVTLLILLTLYLLKKSGKRKDIFTVS